MLSLFSPAHCGTIARSKNTTQGGAGMKFVILFIFGIVVAAAVGAGAVHFLRSPADEPDYTGMIAENRAKIAAVASAADKSLHDLNDNLVSLQEDLDVLNARIEGVEKEVKEMRKARAQQVPGSPGESEPVEAPPSEVEELVKKVLKETEEERQKERQAQRAERMAGMQKMMQDWVTNHVNEFAKKKNWNIAKQEAVNQTIDESMKKMGELFRGFQGGGPPSSETMEKLREIMEETEAKLKEVMTEEEWKEFQESMPGPGMFGPGGMRRGGPGQGQPEGR